MRDAEHSGGKRSARWRADENEDFRCNNLTAVIEEAKVAVDGGVMTGQYHEGYSGALGVSA